MSKRLSFLPILLIWTVLPSVIDSSSLASAAAPVGPPSQLRDFERGEPTPTRARSVPQLGAPSTPTPAPQLDVQLPNRSSNPTSTPNQRDVDIPTLRAATPTPAVDSRDIDLRTPTRLPAAQGNASTSPGSTPAAQTSSPISSGSVSGPAQTASLLGPGVTAYGQRAIFRWGPAEGAVLTVEYGPTTALGWRSVGQPTEVGSVTVQRAVMDGLQTGRSYYYRATLADGLRVVGQTAVTRFETPHVAIRVQPLRIQVIKDGDTDTIFGSNYGEGRYSWEMRLDPRSDIWPAADVIGGCYPGGGSSSLNLPSTFRIPVGYDVTDGAYDGGNPDLGSNDQQDPTYPGTVVSGCVEDYSGPYISGEANTAKVKSGETIQLNLPPEEWTLLDGSGNSSSPASGPPAPAPIGGMPPTTAGEGGESGPGGDTGGGVSPNGAPSPTPCEELLPRGAYVPIRITARGYEVDKISQNVPGAGGTTLRKQKASNTEAVCLDLRASDETQSVGVHAHEGNWEFRIWFEVALLYR